MLILLIGPLLYISCKPKCCAEPHVFKLSIKYATKDKKELLFVSKSEPYRYDTRKIEIYKVIPGDPKPALELLNSSQQKPEKEVGDNSLYLDLPTEDKRISQLIIYLLPSSDKDTITYKGGGDYNLPNPKDVFYNSTSIEELRTGQSIYETRGNNTTSGYFEITVTKPD